MGARGEGSIHDKVARLGAACAACAAVCAPCRCIPQPARLKTLLPHSSPSFPQLSTLLPQLGSPCAPTAAPSRCTSGGVQRVGVRATAGKLVGMGLASMRCKRVGGCRRSSAGEQVPATAGAAVDGWGRAALQRALIALACPVGCDHEQTCPLAGLCAARSASGKTGNGTNKSARRPWRGRRHRRRVHRSGVMLGKM